MGLRPVSQLAKNECGNFRRRENFVAEHDTNDVLARRIDAKWKQFEFILNVGGAAAHQAFDGIDGALWLREKTPTRGLANDDASTRIEADDRRAKRTVIRARDTLRLACLRVPVSHQAVRCAEIDSDDSAHDENQQALQPLRPCATQAPFERW